MQFDSPHSYRVIDDCPRKAFDNPDLSGNVAHCYNASELQDLIFVTGKVSGFTYLNKHCAICNNENVYMEWALYLLNRTLLTMNMGFEERDRRILSQGGVISVPLTQKIAMAAFCPEPIIQRCNETGKWDIYDPDIEQRCNQLTPEYISENGYRRKGHANVYCFMCNNPKGTPVTTECPTISFDVADDMKAFRGSPFTALLTIHPPIVEESQPCSTREVWDPFRVSILTSTVRFT